MVLGYETENFKNYFYNKNRFQFFCYTIQEFRRLFLFYKRSFCNYQLKTFVCFFHR